MARKKPTPEENERSANIRELLQMSNIGSIDNIQSLFNETKCVTNTHLDQQTNNDTQQS